jgi:hypothetical protein
MQGAGRMQHVADQRSYGAQQIVAAFISAVLDGTDAAEAMHATLRGEAPAYW